MGTVYLIFGQTHLSPPSNEPRGLSPRGLSHGHEEAAPIKALGVRAHETHGLSLSLTPRALIEAASSWASGAAAAAGRCHACPAKLPSFWKKLTYSKNATNSADLRMDIACSIHVFFKYVFIISTPHAHYILCVCLMIALWANRNIIIIIISSSSSSIVIINYYYYTAIQWISLETSQNQVRLISEAPPRLHPTQASNPGLAMPGPPELGQVTPTWRSTNPQPW